MKQSWQILSAPEYDLWYSKQSQKHRLQILERMRNIELEGYFGEHKVLDYTHTVWELKWKNGRRVYYAMAHQYKMLLLLGGNKNGQDRDIQTAKKIYARYT